MSQTHRFHLAIGLILLLAFAACNDDDDVTGPDPAVTPTINNIWPHKDGNEWVYSIAYAEYSIDETLTDPLPGPPSMAALHEDLQRPVSGDTSTEFDGLYRLTLDGQITTASGVTSQRLRETLYEPLSSGSSLEPQTAEAPNHLLRLIARSRPDLRLQIADLMATETKSGDNYPSPPILLSGIAFAYEDSGYYGYGDIDTNHSWVYLAGDLEVETEFSLQLLPTLADDIWLTGRIWSRGDLSVGAVTYENVIECMYLVDLGEAVLTDENGEITGTAHDYIYGTIHFAPEVGPIRCRQRDRLTGDPVLQADSSLILDYAMDMVGFSGE